MLLGNRRLDLVLKLVTLAVLTICLLLPLRNLSYALTSSGPLEVDGPRELATGLVSEDSYVATWAAPKRERVLQYVRYGVRYFYFPVVGTDANLFARTMAPPQGAGSLRLEGRLQRFDAVPFAERVREAYALTYEEEVPRGAWILLQDETPDTYRIALYAYPLLALLWLGALFLLVRGLQGRLALPLASHDRTSG